MSEQDRARLDADDAAYNKWCERKGLNPVDEHWEEFFAETTEPRFEVIAGNLLGFDVRFPETEEGYTIRREGKPDYLLTTSIEFTTQEVDPALLGILTGGVMSNPTAPEFAIEVHAPVKRTFWQWLRRKPRLWNHWYVPRARVREEPREEGSR